MSPERWQRIKEVLDISLRLTGAERQAYLGRVSADDAELREEVESLIAAHEEAGDVFDTALIQPECDALAGAVIDHYKILEHIGSGGMGSVYRAVRADQVYMKEVAVKIVRRGLNTELIRRFHKERQILAGLDHPNIATLMDGGTTPDGLPYFVMEFIPGRPIDQYCRENSLTLLERLRLFQTVCAAVEFAHAHGVIHRDIKPGNILVLPGNLPKLVDFGIATTLASSAAVSAEVAVTTSIPALTPAYASPEQRRGERGTGSSDIYSLGVLLYELLAGKRPEAQTSSSWEGARVTTLMPPSRVARRGEIPRDLDNIAMKAMMEEPGQRYRSVAMLREDIERYLAGLPVMARQHTRAYRMSKFVRRHSIAFLSTLAGAALISTLLLLGNQARKRSREANEPPRLTHLTAAPGREFQASFSPDGARVVYAWSGEKDDNPDIYIQSVAGGLPRRLTTDPGEDLSPVWSPDGSQIAWLRTRPDETGIFVSRETGGVHRKIVDLFPTRIATVGRHLDWLRDNALLAAADKTASNQPFRIVLISPVNGVKRELTSPPDLIIGDMSPAFSPDAKSIAFIRATSSGINDIYIAPLEGGAPRRITFDNRMIHSLAWTPDGSSIVFSSERSGNPTLWAVPASGGTPVRIPSVGDNALDPAFSRDGRRMLSTESVRDGNIWRIETTRRTAPHNLISSTLYDSSPQYSPDSTRIAFRSNRSGSDEIWVSDSEGRSPVRITHFDGPLAGTPRWSPDGKRLAFDGRPGNQPRIYTVSADGGPILQATNGHAEEVVPSWSIDGNWIYFASNRTGVWQVWRVRVNGSDEEQVTKFGGFAAFESTDRKYLYYAKGREVPGLWRKRLDHGQEEPVLEQLKPGYWGLWALAANGIYFVDRPMPSGPASIYLYSFATRSARAVHTMEQPPPIGDSGFAASPDGRYLLYTQMDHSGSDIILVEHYRVRD